MKLTNSFQRMRLKNKLTYVFLTAIFFLLVLTLLSLHHTILIYNEQLFDTLRVSTQMATSNGDHKIQKVVEDSYEIATNLEFQELFINLNNSESFSSYQINLDIQNKLYGYLFNKDVLSILIHYDNGKESRVNKDIQRLHSDTLNKIYSEAKELQGEIFWMEPSEETNHTIVLARQIRQIENLSLKPLGIVVYQIDPNTIIKEATHETLHNNVILLSQYNYIFKGDSQLPFHQIKPSKEELSGYSVKSINGHKYFFTYIKSAYKDWIYASYIPYDKLFKSAAITTRIYIILYIGIGIVLAFIINSLVRSILKPVDTLTWRMRKVEQGNFNQNINNDYLERLREGNEVDRLEYDFCLMLDKINHLIDENYIKQLEVQKFHIKALQAQINPHFLYNTLNSIFWLAKVNNQQDIAVMIKSLGNLLRNSIDENKQLLSLGEEVNQLQDYLNIQKIRYKDRLKVILQMDTNIAGYSIPKLTLQPLVENAINYGLEKEIRNCDITIMGYEEEGYIRIHVSDNGAGMSEELVDQVNKGQVKPKGTGIGIKNIRERLNMVFSGDYELLFTSQLHKGTEVIIKIPARYLDDEKTKQG